MTIDLQHLDLFSGIGGFALAARWVGFKTTAFCEIEPYCQRVLRKNFGENIVIHDDIRKLDGSQYAGIDLLTGGFPCQPFSIAGKRKGTADPRYLWGEMRRVIHEAKPAWVVGENVAHFVNMELDAVCADLESEGYEVQPFLIPASAIGAPHRRMRCFIVAYADSEPMGWATVARYQCNQWAVEPNVGRVVNGIPHRVDRLRGLGNAVVPQQAYPILEHIAQMVLLEQKG